ncbi:MAG: hypothetical protein K8R21_08285 [Leptospira sp.]|nr:hypothetical protein [Leptospira sp.]
MRGKLLLICLLFLESGSIFPGECDVRFINQSSDKQEIVITWQLGAEGGSSTFRIKSKSTEYREVPCAVVLNFNVVSINQRTMNAIRQTPFQNGVERMVIIQPGN